MSKIIKIVDFVRIVEIFMKVYYSYLYGFKSISGGVRTAGNRKRY